MLSFKKVLRRHTLCDYQMAPFPNWFSHRGRLWARLPLLQFRLTGEDTETKSCFIVYLRWWSMARALNFLEVSICASPGCPNPLVLKRNKPRFLKPPPQQQACLICSDNCSILHLVFHAENIAQGMLVFVLISPSRFLVP